MLKQLFLAKTEIYILKEENNIGLSLNFWNMQKSDLGYKLSGYVKINTYNYKGNLKYRVLCGSCFSIIKEGIAISFGLLIANSTSMYLPTLASPLAR